MIGPARKRLSNLRSWRSCGLVVLVSALLPLVVAAESREILNESAQRGLARVDSLLAVPDPEEAIKAAEYLHRRLGDHPVYGWQIDGRLGMALLAGGRPEAALPYLENIVRRQPREAAHHRNLGAALLQLKRRGRALSEYQVAAELEPGNSDLRREYGQLLLSFGDTGRAARELVLAAQLCGGCPEVDEPLANLYLKQRDFGRAIEPLQRLYERDAGPERRRLLVATLAAGGADSALSAFVSDLPWPERTTEEWRFLIQAEGRRHQWPESLRIGELLAAGEPAGLPAAVADEAPFWGQVALNLLEADELKKSLAVADRAIMLEPDNVVYRNNRVVILTRMGRDEEAREEWRKVQELDPTRTEDAP